MPHSGSRPLPRRFLIPLVVILTVMAPAMVLASDLFADVPNTNPFHDSIGAVARGGITTGCGGGIYCPSGNVTRGQMAAFMHRGFTRVAEDSNTSDLFSTAPTTVTSVSITPGLPSSAVGGAANFIVANASVSLYVSSASGCLCYYEVYLTHNGVQIGQTQFVTIGTAPTVVNVPVTGVAEVTASGGQAIGVVVDQYIGTSSTRAYANLSATTAPFGATGTNVLSLGGETFSDAEAVRPGE